MRLDRVGGKGGEDRGMGERDDMGRGWVTSSSHVRLCVTCEVALHVRWLCCLLCLACVQPSWHGMCWPHSPCPPSWAHAALASLTLPPLLGPCCTGLTQAPPPFPQGRCFTDPPPPTPPPWSFIPCPALRHILLPCPALPPPHPHPPTPMWP